MLRLGEKRVTYRMADGTVQDDIGADPAQHLGSLQHRVLTPRRQRCLAKGVCVRADPRIGDREFRVERRRRVRDIADIGGAGPLPGKDAILLEADRCEMDARALGEDRVGTEIEVGLLLIELQLAAGCKCGCFEDRTKATVHRAQILTVARTGQELAAGELRDDVRSGAALDDEPVHARVVAQLLAPQRDTVVCVHKRVQGVDAVVGIPGGMGSLATECPLPMRACERVLD